MSGNDPKVVKVGGLQALPLGPFCKALHKGEVPVNENAGVGTITPKPRTGSGSVLHDKTVDPIHQNAGVKPILQVATEDGGDLPTEVFKRGG